MCDCRTSWGLYIGIPVPRNKIFIKQGLYNEVSCPGQTKKQLTWIQLSIGEGAEILNTPLHFQLPYDCFYRYKCELENEKIRRSKSITVPSPFLEIKKNIPFFYICVCLCYTVTHVTLSLLIFTKNP